MTKRTHTPSYPAEQRDRGVRLFREHRREYSSDNAAYQAIALKWSRKFGQVVKVYPEDEEGMRSYGKAPEFYGSVQGEGRA